MQKCENFVSHHIAIIFKDLPQLYIFKKHMHLMSRRDMIEVADQSAEHIRLSKQTLLEMHYDFWLALQHYYKELYDSIWIDSASEDRNKRAVEHDIGAEKNCFKFITDVFNRLPKMFDEMLNSVQNFGINSAHFTPGNEASRIAWKTTQQKMLDNLDFFQTFLHDMFDITEFAMNKEYLHVMDLMRESEDEKNKLYQASKFIYFQKKIHDQQKRWMERVVKKRDDITQSVHAFDHHSVEKEFINNLTVDAKMNTSFLPMKLSNPYIV